jgi:hypothetical protein
VVDQLRAFETLDKSPVRVISVRIASESVKDCDALPRTRFRPDTRLDPGGQHVESHGGRYGWSAGGCPAH